MVSHKIPSIDLTVISSCLQNALQHQKNLSFYTHFYTIKNFFCCSKEIKTLFELCFEMLTGYEFMFFNI